MMGQATIVTQTNYHVVFEGVRGKGYRGDIALDDVSLTSGVCGLQPTAGSTLPAPASTPGRSSYDISDWFYVLYVYWLQEMIV